MTIVGAIGATEHDMFAENIVDCLPDVGVSAVHLGMPRRNFKDRRIRATQDLLGQAVPKLDEKWQRAFARKAVDAECDLVISTWGALLPAAVEALRDAGIVTVLWFPDHISNIDRQAMFVTPYRRVYLKDELVATRMRTSYGIPADYLPEACNPSRHRSEAEPGVDPHFVTAGSIYPTRARLLDHLANDGMPLKLYGASPPVWMGGARAWESSHQRRSVFGQEKADIFRRAAGVLNNLHPSEVSSVNCRMFEAAGSGAAVLCENRPALAGLFEPGVEVLPFDTYDELVKNMRALLDDPGLTRRIGDAAAVRAHAEHTYQHRLRKILTDCLP